MVGKTKILSKNSGFTLIELIIVIVVIGILVGLVTNAFGGLQDDARDSERETDVQALSSELEAYYSDYGMYPTLANLADDAWVETYLTGIEPETMTDSRGELYVYVPAPANCNNTSSECTSYNLTADLEEDGYGAEDEDGELDDLREKSIHNGQ